MEVFICGTSDQVIRIRKCLKNDVEVIGSTNFQDNPFDRKLNRDCIYIADEAQAQILQGRGILEKKILRYDWFPHTYFDDPIKGLSSEYNALLLGMSHVQCAIDIDVLSEETNRSYQYFKEAAPSLDLFLHKKMFDRIEANQRKELKRVVIELPYYIFNYDLSRFGDFVYTKLNYFELAGNYHHLQEKSAAREKIDMFHLYWSVFNEAYYIQPESRKLPAYLAPLKKVYHIYKAVKNRDAVWSKEFADTVAENGEIWKELLSDIKNSCPNAEIILLVMPFNPAFRISHKKEIEQSKNTFYSLIAGSDIRIIDEFDYIKNPSLFQDHCHLNEKGGKLYSKHIAELLRD